MIGFVLFFGKSLEGLGVVGLDPILPLQTAHMLDVIIIIVHSIHDLNSLTN